jgi:hypothetical protein
MAEWRPRRSQQMGCTTSDLGQNLRSVEPDARHVRSIPRLPIPAISARDRFRQRNRPLPDSCFAAISLEEPHLPALRAAHGPFPGNGPPPHLGPRRHRPHRRRQARRAMRRSSGRGDQSPIRQRAADVRRPVPRLTLVHHVLGSWLFAAALARRSNLSVMLNSLLHRRYFTISA